MNNLKKFNEQFNHRFELGQRSLDNISNDIKTYIKTLIAEMIILIIRNLLKDKKIINTLK